MPAQRCARPRLCDLQAWAADDQRSGGPHVIREYLEDITFADAAGE